VFVLKIKISKGEKHFTEFIFFFKREILHIFHCIFATPTKHKATFHLLSKNSQIKS